MSGRTSVEFEVEFNTHHDVPGEGVGLGLHARVPGAADNLLGAQELLVRDVDAPPDPSPVLAVFVGRRPLGDLGQPPGLAAIDRHFAADNLVAVAVGVPGHLERLSALERKDRALVRREEGRVDVQVVDDEVRLEPPALGGRRLGVDVRRKHPGERTSAERE